MSASSRISRRTTRPRATDGDPSAIVHESPRPQSVYMTLFEPETGKTESTCPWVPRTATYATGMVTPFVADTDGAFAITSSSWVPSGSRYSPATCCAIWLAAPRPPPLGRHDDHGTLPCTTVVSPIASAAAATPSERPST